MGQIIHRDDIPAIHMHEPPFDRDISVFTSPFCSRASQAFACGLTVLPPRHFHEVHTHPSEEVLYILSGSGTAELDGVPVEIRAGCVIQCAANEPHGFVNTEDEPLELFWIASPPGREKGFLPGADKAP